MTPPASRTPAQRGRASRAKGAAFERAIVNAIRPWFPDVRRSRDNGSSATSDTGDITDAWPCWWSCKDVKAGDSCPPALIDAWHGEAVEKCDGLVPVVVQKRRGHADPLRSWCWVRTFDLAVLLGAFSGDGDALDEINAASAAGWARIELRGWLDLLAATNHARTPGPDTAPGGNP